ncbi:hypothetical protein ACFWBX_08025 [Streptomyces sp. NPDC059991]|uniref:MmyB family transcriptional regulator n=1 Tax=Streptomyces sp. NPDC059991 TaxID=3347028 RepID=UPI00367AF7E0
MLAQNDLARSLLGGVCTVSEHGRNVVWRWFADPAARDAYPAEEHAHYSRVHVADLRAAVGRGSGDLAATPARGAAARRRRGALWEMHEVAVRRHSRDARAAPGDRPRRPRLPGAPRPGGQPAARPARPAAGTDAADRLALLPAVGEQRLVG